MQTDRVQNFVALLVDDFALLVGYVVKFQQLLADVEVARFHLALRAFDAAGHHACFDGFAFWHFEAIHHGAHAVARKDAHQLVIQAQVEARRTRVALAARSAPQLVVDAAAFVPFGRDDAQAAQRLDFFVVSLPVSAQLLDAFLFFGIVQRVVGFNGGDHFFEVAPQHDIGTATGHIGGDGDHAGAPRLGHDVGLALVLLGIEHLVRQLGLLQQVGNDFGVFDRGGAYQHGLAAFVAFADVVQRGLVFFRRGFVHAIELVFSLAGAVGWNDHGFQRVDFLKLVGFGVGRAGHAGEFFVQAEIVLEGDGGHRLVFGLDGHILLGLYGLVQAVAPAATRHQATGKFVHNDDFRAFFTVLYHVVLVAVVQIVRPQSRIQMVHQRDISGVVQRCAFGQQAHVLQNGFGVLVSLLGQIDLLGFFVHGKVAGFDDAFAGHGVFLPFLAREHGRDLVHGLVQIALVFGLAADDERGTRFVDQNGIHFIDDGVVQRALHALDRVVHHVVAQVVKAVFVVGAVGDVGVVGGLFLLAVHAGQVDADGEPQKVVQPAHGLGIAVGQIVVDGNNVYPFARQGVEVNRQRGCKRFAFARAHFGDFAFVQRLAANHLHIEMSHVHDTLAGFAHQGKGLRQQAVQRGAFAQAFAESLGLGRKIRIA